MHKICCSDYSLQSKYSLKIFLYWRIFASKYSLRSEYSQNFICEFHNFTFKRIFAWKYSHTSEYSLTNNRISANIRYLLLQIILESLSQVLGLN